MVNLLSEFQERKTEWNEKLDDWLISLSIGQNQMMEHIQTTELEEHEINLQGFVWTNCLNILLKKLARWDTENKSPFLTSVSDSGKNYHERFWLVRVMCATLKKQTRDSGWLRCGDGRQYCAKKQGAHFEKCTLLELWGEHGEVRGRMRLLIHFGGEWVLSKSGDDGCDRRYF